MKTNLWALLGVGVTLVLVLAASKPSWTQPLSSCVPSSERLCLNDGRFGVEVDWEIEDGSNGRGTGEILTDETGYFWFFNEENVEVVVKVLDACAVNDHYWVFAAGLTNVRVTILVEHLDSGSVWTRTNPQGVAFQPIQDTAAFPCSDSAQSVVNLGSVSFKVPDGWRVGLAHDPSVQAPTSVVLEEEGSTGTIVVSLASSFAHGLEPFSTFETEMLTVDGYEAVQTTYLDSDRPYMRTINFVNSPSALSGFSIEYRGDVDGYSQLSTLVESLDVQ